MSLEQPTYEQLVASVKEMKTQLSEVKQAANIDEKKEEKEETKEVKNAFKKAQQDMKNDDKEKTAQEKEDDKVKDAFKKAQDEEDPDKKHEAMKKAVEMKEDHEEAKKARYSNDYKDDKEATEEDDKEREAKIANTIIKKIPIMNKILEATKIIDPSNLKKVEKELTAATLDEVEDRWNTIRPFIAATGLESRTTPGAIPHIVPFQASQALQGDNPTDIFSASVDDIDFSKVPTSKILEMYQ